MFDKVGKANRLRKFQSEMKKKVREIFVEKSRGDFTVLVRGDRTIEKIEFAGEENKLLKDLINDAFKEVEKKSEKKLRSDAMDFFGLME